VAPPSAGVNGTAMQPMREPRANAGAAGTIQSSKPRAQFGSAGTGGNSATAEAGGMGGSGSKAEGAAGSAGQTQPDTGAKADCTASPWVDPGTVAAPKVTKIDPTVGDAGHPWGYTEAIDKYDYVEEEFFFSGTTPKPYTSRMLVRRPRDPAKFTGTAFVEWYNVSGDQDFDPLWMYSWEFFMRAGHVQISVTAQKSGADALKTTDPTRYADINQPDDAMADAIFSQAGLAIRSQSELILGPCMAVNAMIGMGQSQSSMRISAYIDNTARNDKVYDGFITQSGAEPKSNDPGFPTFVVMTMTEWNGSLKDGPTLVKWVLAGATHFDKFMMGRAAARAGDIGKSVDVNTVCAEPLNTYPSQRVYYAINDWMHKWVRHGERPPPGMLLSGDRLSYETDEYGNVKGGIRLPEVDVPTAKYTPDNSPRDPFDITGLACSIGGVTQPFTQQQLMRLYPTHDDYVMKYKAAAEKAVASGVLLEEDSKAAIEEATKAPIPN
jgi:hypothetical protein